jgi:hypothetical protein
MAHRLTSPYDRVNSSVVHSARLLLSSNDLDSEPMSLMDNQAIRKENFRALKKEHGSKDIQEKLGWSKQQLSQYIGQSKNARPITDAVARRIERAYSLPDAWMDYPHYETELLLQKLVDFIRSQPVDRQKALLQLVELAITVGRDPTEKP